MSETTYTDVCELDRIDDQLHDATNSLSEWVDAICEIQRIKTYVLRHGMSQAVLNTVDPNHSLGDAIGMTFPTILSSNARDVGIACVENIDVTIASAKQPLSNCIQEYGLSVKQYLKVMRNHSERLLQRLMQLKEKYQHRLGEACPVLDDISYDTISARLDALAFIVERLKTFDGDPDTLIQQCKGSLHILNYRLERISDKEPEQSETIDRNEGEPEYDIVPESPYDTARDLTRKSATTDVPSTEETLRPDNRPDGGWTRDKIVAVAVKFVTLVGDCAKLDFAEKINRVCNSMQTDVASLPSCTLSNSAECTNRIRCAKRYLSVLSTLTSVVWDVLNDQTNLIFRKALDDIRPNISQLPSYETKRFIHL